MLTTKHLYKQYSWPGAYPYHRMIRIREIPVTHYTYHNSISFPGGLYLWSLTLGVAWTACSGPTCCACQSTRGGWPGEWHSWWNTSWSTSSQWEGLLGKETTHTWSHQHLHNSYPSIYFFKINFLAKICQDISIQLLITDQKFNTETA